MARRGEWPAKDDVDAWADLANTAMQLATLGADLAENEHWAKTMRDLIARRLPYTEFTEARMEALSDRLRRRKLDQTNLRYKFGFKARRARLVRADVKAYLKTPG